MAEFWEEDVNYEQFIGPCHCEHAEHEHSGVGCMEMRGDDAFTMRPCPCEAHWEEQD